MNGIYSLHKKYDITDQKIQAAAFYVFFVGGTL